LDYVNAVFRPQVRQTTRNANYKPKKIEHVEKSTVDITSATHTIWGCSYVFSQECMFAHA